MTTIEISELEKALQSLSLEAPIPQIDTAEVLTRPLDLCRSYLASLLANLVECDIQAAYNSIQWPNNIWNGDLAIILPKLKPKSNPNELSSELLQKFPQDHPLFPLPVPEGVHFRIFINPTSLPKLLLPYILDRRSSFGNDASIGLSHAASPESDKKKLVVEFSSPNITSEIQGKHLRSTILGAFMANLYESMGWNVTRINYLGDWGKPIALLRVGWEKYGSEEEYTADPVGHLLDVYHKIEQEFLPLQAESKKLRDEAVKQGVEEGENQAQLEIETQGLFAERNEAFKKLEEGDEEAVAFWKRVREANIENYTDFYSRLGVTFDEYSGESQVSPATMNEVEQLLKDKGICEESGGAWIVHMQKYGAKSGTAIIRDRTGSSTYLLRDLAAVLERDRKYSFDKMIFVVASDNSVHFTQLIKIIEAMEMKELADKLQHVRFSEVSKMGEKLGKGYKPQTILNQCSEAMTTTLGADEKKAVLLGNSQDAAEFVGVSALLAQELSTRTATAHAFDTSTMSIFKLGTGPDLQYWYAKLCSLLKGQTPGTELSDEDYGALAEDDPANLLRILAQWPEVTHATYSSLEPAAIVTYLASVTEQLSECLGDEEEEPSTTAGQLALYEATRIVMERGMKLLGLTPIATVQQERADTPIAE